MATKKADRLTVEERAQIGARYEVWNLGSVNGSTEKWPSIHIPI